MPSQTQEELKSQQCSGMYSRKAWGGSVDPFILAKFVKPQQNSTEDPLVSLAVFEWRDKDLIGVWPSEKAAKVRNKYLLRTRPFSPRKDRLTSRLRIERTLLYRKYR